MSKKIDLEELKSIAIKSKAELWRMAKEKNRDVKLYIHWSAGHYNQVFDDYHLNILGNGDIFITVEDLSQLLSHTYKRNSGAIGISLSCAYLASPNNLGDEPPTIEQIDIVSKVIAVLAKILDLTIDKYRVLTHGEAGDNVDGLFLHECYGQMTTLERWDLAIIKKGDVWGSGGEYLRHKARNV